jgi:hypothetical protein
MNRTTMKLLAAGVLVAVAGIASAESNFQTGAGALTATAHLDFQINIPKILYLRVGTGVDRTTVATIDKITFSPAAANVGDSSVISGTGGDLTGGVVTARVIANNGNVTFSSATLGALNDGAAHTISYGQIAVAAATNTTGTILAHPALADGATTTITLTAASNVVNQDAKWTYTYLNQTVPSQGTYGGVNTNNSRVTYTASIL